MVPTNLFPTPAALGYAVGQQFGPEMVQAGKKIGRWASRRYRSKRARARRRSKRKKTEHIGETPGVDAAKTHVLQDASGPSGQSTRTLYFEDCTQVPKTSTNEINGRQRDIVNYRGFKVCQEWKNKSSFPLLCNVAVIALKGDADSPTLSTDFFRGYGSDRNLNFGDGLESLDFHCKPINTDKYTVVKHMRFKLGSAAGNDSEGFHDLPNYAMKEFYVPINRQLRYRGNGTCHTPFFLVHWCDEFQTPGGTPGQPVVDFAQNVTAYFKEPQPMYAKFS